MAASLNNLSVGIDVSVAWRRFKDRLHAFALRRVRPASDADDVVQDVLVRLLQHRDQSSPTAWRRGSSQLPETPSSTDTANQAAIQTPPANARRCRPSLLKHRLKNPMS